MKNRYSHRQKKETASKPPRIRVTQYLPKGWSQARRFPHFAICEMRKTEYLCFMRKHNGMRPQDIAVLLKIIALDGKSWQLKDLSNELHLSISEISESLNRSRIAGLLDTNKKSVSRHNMLEFLIHGVKYVFPQQPGPEVRGVPTAHSHPFMKKHISSQVNYVWPDYKGNKRGFAIEPFYKTQPAAAKEDPNFHKLLALVDAVRVGRVREVQLAREELKKMIMHEA